MLKFIKKTFSKINIPKTRRTSLVLGILILALLIPQVTNAISVAGVASSALGAIGGGLEWIFFRISWFFALLGSFAIGILIWVLQIVILASTGLVNSPAVQTGFPILLSVANLGFVLAVIMIAVATIIRNQTYNIKKFLVNVVIMAVAVNFGLVISGAILGVSNRITNYFLDSMTGGSPFKLADTIAGIVNPQKLLTDVSVIANNENGNAGGAPTATSTAEQIKLGGAVGSMITPVIGAWMSILVVVILVISFFSLIASFVIRYLKLTFLLILLPVAWMGSILPGKGPQGWAGTWWKKFNELAFYPPIVLFFMWLALRVGGNMTYKDDLALPKESLPFLGPLVANTLQVVLNQLVMAGILIGGNYAAKMAGAEVSKKAFDTAKSLQGWATGKVKTGLRRTGTRAIDTAGKKDLRIPFSGGKTFANPLVRMSTGISNLQGSESKLARGVGRVAQLATNPLSRYATRAQDKMSAEASKSYKDMAAGMTEGELKVRAKVATGLELAAILDRASKDPKLMRGVIDNIPDGNRKSLSKDKDLYKRYGYEKTYEAAMLESGQTIEDKLPTFNDAKKKYEEAKKNGPVSDEATKEFVKAEKEFTDAIKKLSADGANGLIFAKVKGPDGKPTDEFVMPKEQREAAMQQLVTKGGWNPGTFTDFLKKAQEGNNVDEVRKLIEGMEPEKINPAAIKAMKNGAMKNLGVGGEDVFGKELFEKAKKYHGAEGDRGIKERRNATMERLKKEGGNYSKETLDDLEAAGNLDE